MRKCNELVKAYFSPQLKLWRKNLHQTQEKTAEMLLISSRAYGQLERGESCFSTSTMVLYLSYLTDEEIVQHIRYIHKKLVEMEYNTAE